VGKVIYISHGRARRVRELFGPGPARDIVSIDLEFMGETVDEYFVADIPPIDTLQESLLAQIEAGEPPVRKR
jgi:hypothetical protein